MYLHCNISLLYINALGRIWIAKLGRTTWWRHIPSWRVYYLGSKTDLKKRFKVCGYVALLLILLFPFHIKLAGNVIYISSVYSYVLCIKYLDDYIMVVFCLPDNHISTARWLECQHEYQVMQLLNNWNFQFQLTEDEW